MTAKRPSQPSPSPHGQAAPPGPDEQPPGRYAEEEPPPGRTGSRHAARAEPRVNGRTLPADLKPRAPATLVHPDSSVPGAGCPDSSVPGAGCPDSSVPGAGCPDSLVPGAGCPDSLVPGAGCPDSSVPGVAQTPPAFVWAGHPLALLVTCEHAGNLVPHDLLPLFRGQEELLASHRGYDAGALDLALALGRAFAAPVLAVGVTRLVVDANRSPGRRGLFSSFTKVLSPARKRRILADHHAPHLRKVDEAVAANRARGLVTLHVAAHTFTPVLDGRTRRADVGLLYDPARRDEPSLCAAWRRALRALAPGLAVLRNSPYRGKSDGLPTWLRRRHPEDAYMGVEVELNQKHLADATAWKTLVDAMVIALGRVLR